MDFFEYASITSQFVNTNDWWVIYLVGGLCFAVVYVFQAVGLFIIANREGYKNRWMAFIPFLNTYYIGVCAQKNRCFRTVDTKTVSLVAAVLEVLLFAGYLIYHIAILRLDAANCIHDIPDDSVIGGSRLVLGGVPESLSWAAWCFNYLSDYILWWADLIFLFLQVLILSAFFQTYSARRYMLFTITSVLFPIQGILIFILRNNKGLSYRDYIRSEQEKQYRMYRQYQQQNFNQNPYNQNPYSRNNQYGGGPQDGAQGDYKSGAVAPDDPFSEFGGDKGDPFDSGENN